MHDDPFPRKSFVRQVSLCSLMLICLTHSQSTQTASLSRLPVADRAFIASKIYSSLRCCFAGWNSLPGFDLEGAYRSYLQTVMSVADRREFDLATMKFLALFRNGHTVLVDSWLNREHGQPIGFYARPIDGKWTVQDTAIPAMKAGDIISKIDGVDSETFFRRQQEYISGSSESAQRYNLFYLSYLFPERFILTLDNGRNVSIDRSTHKSLPGNQRNPLGRWLTPNTVAYIRITSFLEPPAEEKALAYLVQFTKAKALIVDVRDNAGGLIPIHLMKALMDRPYRDWKRATPVHVGFSELSEMGQNQKGVIDFERKYLGELELPFRGNQIEWGGDVIPPDGALFHGQLIFLVDGGCASACEELVGPFKENHRATLLGETTQGSSGPSYEQDLGDGISVGIAAVHQFFPDGAEFEGIGIMPDVEVRPSANDLKNGRDVVLEMALELAGK